MDHFIKFTLTLFIIPNFVVLKAVDVTVIIFGSIDWDRDATLSELANNHPFIGRHLFPSLSDPLCEEDLSLSSGNATPHIVL